MARCVRQLDPSGTVGQDQPLVLGLSAEKVLRQLPPQQVGFHHMKSPLNLNTNAPE